MLIDKGEELLYKIQAIVLATGEPYVAYTGRHHENLEAPFKYRLHSTTGNILWWEDGRNECKEMPIMRKFQRAAHSIGVAVNIFLFKDSSLPLSYGQVIPRMLIGKQIIAHWGVYIQNDVVSEVSIYDHNWISSIISELGSIADIWHELQSCSK